MELAKKGNKGGREEGRERGTAGDCWARAQRSLWGARASHQRHAVEDGNGERSEN